MPRAKDIDRLSKRVRRLREAPYNLLWREICERLHILNVDGSPATGLAEKIGYYPDYEPGREVRRRLGLRDMCTKCKRAFRRPGKKIERIPDSPARRIWNRKTRAEQDRILELLFAALGEIE